LASTLVTVADPVQAAVLHLATFRAPAEVL
jgi:hypothetical protein